MPSPEPTASRCAVASRASGESGVGTAPPVRRWLLLEQPGPWSRTALQEVLAALPGDVRATVARLTREAGLRTLLVRRPGGGALHEGARRVHLGSCAGTASWLEALDVPDLAALADVPLDALAAGEPLGLGAPAGPLALVCTHGTKDLCCAVDGRPVAAALAQAYGEAAWECSHVGGDRFAGNLVVAPHGEFHGRVEAEGGLATFAAALAGEVRPTTMRGRASYDPWQQTAEVEVRAQLGLLARGDVECGPARPDGSTARVPVTLPSGGVEVLVERRVGHTLEASRCRPGMELFAYEAALPGR
ncbi:hypothetical protein EV189_2107 [Motilibacter rhizosphaerae]|uniref:Sucrase/ferredoxin-like protein n=1 Tax=Motilibacter rhizosphaerae TaxID=598652 RepID=A0A4Q7NV84_9ACTN|nr:sucrase ferredoxin [Motilibacter rhizosphaerae]RZS90322.1 hypothetical protein EV189_2107 [Motilibacter rhizosphaerae]